jgi:caffeoyl-CoA O-methyltransferase
MTMQLVNQKIEDYADKYTGKVERVFEDLRKETYENCDNPQMQVGKVEGSFLRMLVAMSKARTVLEIGTFTGYSALMMAAALPKDGDLFTLEFDETHACVAQKYFDKVDCGSKITIIHGDARKTLDYVEGPLDFAFIDADKSSYDYYYEKVLSILKPGGVIAFDNMLWSGEVLDPKSKDAKAIHALNQKLAKDKRVDKVLLTVRDGIMLARKRP